MGIDYEYSERRETRVERFSVASGRPRRAAGGELLAAKAAGKQHLTAHSVPCDDTLMRLMTVRQAAEKLGLPNRTLWSRIESGSVPTYKAPGYRKRRLVRLVDLVTPRKARAEDVSRSRSAASAFGRVGARARWERATPEQRKAWGLKLAAAGRAARLRKRAEAMLAATGATSVTR